MNMIAGGTEGGDPWQHRVDSADWDAITTEVNLLGGALLPELLTPAEAEQIRGLYEQAGYFRSTVNMGQHRFGEGEYRYFKTPYPEPVERLKQALYPRLLPIARDWWAKLGRPAPWPDTLDEWLRMCHDAGQDRSTAILLRYGEGDWNALHRDLYGDLVFPLQVVINLNEPGADHTGGEFLLLEQRPRAQSRGTATLLPHCRGYVFTTRDRPVRSARGWSAAPVRHGVSVIRSGERLHARARLPRRVMTNLLLSTGHAGWQLGCAVPGRLAHAVRNVNSGPSGSAAAGAWRSRLTPTPVMVSVPRASKAISSNPLAANQALTRGVRSGDRRCRVQITVASGRHRAGAASTVCWMSRSLTLPKMPHSSSTPAGSASAKLVTRLASAWRTSTCASPASAAARRARAALVASASIRTARTSSRRGWPGSTPMTSRPCPAQRLTTETGPAGARSRACDRW